MNKFLSLAVISALVLAAGPARAGSAQNDLLVEAEVLGACTIDPANLDFGQYDPTFVGDLDDFDTITVKCTENSAFWIGLDLGANDDGTNRFMSNGAGATLGYELYRDAGRTDVWDNTDGGLGTTASTHVGVGYDPVGQGVPVYGRIFDLQAVPAGNYSDTVRMTVNF